MVLLDCPITHLHLFLPKHYPTPNPCHPWYSHCLVIVLVLADPQPHTPPWDYHACHHYLLAPNIPHPTDDSNTVTIQPHPLTFWCFVDTFHLVPCQPYYLDLPCVSYWELIPTAACWLFEPHTTHPVQ